MKKSLMLLLALCLCISSKAGTLFTEDNASRFVVKATSETYLKADGSFSFQSWQKTDSVESLVIIDWEKGIIEFKDHGTAYEGPYSITSTGKPYKDAEGRLSVNLTISEGFEDEGTVFIITVTEGTSVKTMTKGYLYQIFSEDVFGFELGE